MTVVVSLEDFRPSPRYDSVAWNRARIEEAATPVGPWTVLETKTLSSLDADPANPDYRNFTTVLGSAEGLWYRVTFLDVSNNVGQPTYPVQNTTDARPVYATVSELAGILHVNATNRHVALRRVLEAASQEIDDEIGTADIHGNVTPYGSPPALVSEVAIERAVEHWKQMEAPFGLVGLGDAGAVYTARDTWDRHAHKLGYLKGSWGIA